MDVRWAQHDHAFLVWIESASYYHVEMNLSIELSSFSRSHRSFITVLVRGTKVTSLNVLYKIGLLNADDAEEANNSEVVHASLIIHDTLSFLPIPHNSNYCMQHCFTWKSRHNVIEERTYLLVHGTFWNSTVSTEFIWTCIVAYIC